MSITAVIVDAVKAVCLRSSTDRPRWESPFCCASYISVGV